MIRDGEVTYMSPKGKRAMQKACRTMRHLASCKRNCKQTEEFYGGEVDCEKVDRVFYEGCKGKSKLKEGGWSDKSALGLYSTVLDFLF